TAARALEAFADPAAFRAFVVESFNDRGEEQAWKIPQQTIETVAELLVHGAPKTRARTAGLLRYLSGKEQTAWDQGWSVHETRYAKEIAELRDKAKDRAEIPSQYPQEQLQKLAFGAYVGLVREQGSTHTRTQRASLGVQVVRVRQTALSRILTLALKD